MHQNNEKMFQLVKMIPSVIIKRVATFPPFTGPDLERYTATLDELEPASETYLEILANDEVQVSPADIIDLRNLLRKMQQVAFFEFLDVLEEVRDYVITKVEEAPPKEKEITMEESAKDDEPNDTNGPDQEEGEINGADT